MPWRHLPGVDGIGMPGLQGCGIYGTGADIPHLRHGGASAGLLGTGPGDIGAQPWHPFFENLGGKRVGRIGQHRDNIVITIAGGDQRTFSGP